MVNLEEFNLAYSYKFDPKGRDKWQVLRPNADGIYRGDCEDYSLSVLFYIICKGSWLKFWWMLVTRQAKMCYVVTKNDDGHAVLKFGDQYIDNWTRQFVPLAEMKSIGHVFHKWQYLPIQVALKMIYGKY